MEMARVQGREGPAEARLPEAGRVPAGRCLGGTSQEGQGVEGAQASACAPAIRLRG